MPVFAAVAGNLTARQQVASGLDDDANYTITCCDVRVVTLASLILTPDVKSTVSSSPLIAVATIPSVRSPDRTSPDTK